MKIDQPVEEQRSRSRNRFELLHAGLCGLVRRQVPLARNMALLSTLGLLVKEIPGDLVIVHGHRFDRLISASASDRDRRKHHVGQRVLNELNYFALVVATYDDLTSFESISFATRLVQQRR